MRVQHLVPGAAVLLLLAGCAAGEDVGNASGPTSPDADPLTVVAVGDSVTEADSSDFNRGDIGPASWAATTDGDGVDVLGGWAVAGATTSDMRDGVSPEDADVLVLMAGTNDVRTGIPWSQSERSLREIVGTVGVDRVLACELVPLDEAPAALAEFNDHLEQLAADEGWDVVDCAADVRDAAGNWVPGTSDDGIHPNAEGAALIGATVHEALVD